MSADAMSAPLPPPPAYRLSKRMSRMKTSAVREILKIAERPDILSFAGGLPAPELFPVDAIAKAFEQTFAREGRPALQYSTTEGFAPLREWIASHLARKGQHVHADQVLITSGSQQGLDLVGKVLLDPGDLVVVEDPSYLAALQTFGGYEVDFATVRSDDAGMDTDDLAALLKKRVPKLLYVIPNFQNPKGTTLSLERRKALVRLAQEHRFIILEDDPYGELRFKGVHLPSLASMDDQGVVLSLSTFSKTLAPGLRLGWVTGPRPLLKSLTIAKQATDLHTATLAQRATALLLETFDYAGHIQALMPVYSERATAMLAALEAHMPKGTKWTRPDGGMFLWVELPQGLDAATLLPRAVEQKVAFVPGAPFFANDQKPQFMRLNYSNRPPDLINEGMRRLGSVISDAL
ncbi:PLP-dependent aminotransferase family protein [Corallococcus sp. AB004]|uniref:aminotransferase-like domain-containing protein n=1 Tax=Corallococcus TaxID=83461 RepID=UPI000EA0B38F|nr:MULTISPECIES: PLP-dependent aminotransferase family protein [Corallococcus]RKI30134.1 PLP-dependent aminotransferase family protein [Corallococcus sp. AB004]NPC75814.1 PLP-dependent aminotransferase family protein [Corallococcus exiguus]NPD26612.1 PLP-dependent aminotransferase family protein [Corallococcus exiguus]NRD50511.1 PLP-dependent aminotransferase family protein [Corallococcus exiguus]RKH97805.1 PLP-dependent aminotransferase family protein [Corallococcus sp. AB038B]